MTIPIETLPALFKVHNCAVRWISYYNFLQKARLGYAQLVDEKPYILANVDGATMLIPVVVYYESAPIPERASC